MQLQIQLYRLLIVRFFNDLVNYFNKLKNSLSRPVKKEKEVSIINLRTTQWHSHQIHDSVVQFIQPYQNNNQKTRQRVKDYPTYNMM